MTSAVLLQRLNAVAQPIMLRAHSTKFAYERTLIAVEPVEYRSHDRHIIAQTAHVASQREQRGRQPLQIYGLW